MRRLFVKGSGSVAPITIGLSVWVDELDRFIPLDEFLAADPPYSGERILGEFVVQVQKPRVRITLEPMYAFEVMSSLIAGFDELRSGNCLITMGDDEFCWLFVCDGPSVSMYSSDLGLLESVRRESDPFFLTTLPSADGILLAARLHERRSFVFTTDEWGSVLVGVGDELVTLIRSGRVPVDSVHEAFASRYDESFRQRLGG